jgi:hypothetical protein
MGHRIRPEIPKEIRDVQQRFAHWRQSRPKRGPIPEPLWQAATALAVKYGLYTVARLLRLNSQALRQRTATAKTLDQVPPPCQPLEAFIELEPSQFQPPQAAMTMRHCQIEFAGPNRCTMTVHLNGWSHDDLAGVARVWMGLEK